MPDNSWCKKNQVNCLIYFYFVFFVIKVTELIYFPKLQSFAKLICCWTNTFPSPIHDILYYTSIFHELLPTFFILLFLGHHSIDLLHYSFMWINIEI